MSVRSVAMMVLATAAVALGAGAAKLTEDKPPLPPPRSGDVTGRIEPADRLRQLHAVSRVTGKTFRPDNLDPRTGSFAFRNLPGDATYDICMTTADGRTMEGIDLDFVDARLVRLAAERRKQLDMPPERQHAFSSEDVRELLAHVRDLKDFMEIRRALYIRGHGRRATMLVELMRAREFFDRKGDELIWRVELWYFENQFGGWERLANQERVLRRRRIPEPQWRKIHVEYYPQLSAYVKPDGSSEPVEFRIPDKPDPSRGRVAGSEIEIQTVPHISGLDVKPAATSQPATAPNS